MRTWNRITKLLSRSLLICVCLLAGAGCPIKPPMGSDIPVAVYDGTNERYLIVFVKENEDPAESRIVGRFLNGNGTLAGNEFAIDKSGDYNKCIAVAHDDLNGRFLVLWVTPPADSSEDSNIFGRIINDDGTVYSGPVLISGAPEDQYCPSLAFGVSPEAYFISWADDRFNTGPVIHGQMVDAGGSRIGTEILISDRAIESSRTSTLYDPDNDKFLVVWNSAFSISGQFLTGDGALQGNYFIISDAEPPLKEPSAVRDTVNGNYLVVWKYRSSLRLQLLDPDGSLSGNSVLLTENMDNKGLLPLVFDPVTQRFLVVFSYDPEYPDEELDPTVLGTLVDSTGNIIHISQSDQFPVSDRAYKGNYFPSAACNTDDGQCLVVWKYDYSESKYSDIHGRIVNDDGTINSDIILISNGGDW